MAGGIKPFRKLQIGKEATAGTAVAATTIWRGEGSLKDTRKIESVAEDTGYLISTLHTNTQNFEAGITLAETPATFEQLCYLLEGGVKKVTTGSADGSGSGKVYTYPIATTSAPTLQTFTVEGGDNQQEEVAEYCIVRNIKLSGRVNEAVRMSAEMVGRQVTASTFTAAVSLPTVEDILTNKGLVYIDPTTTIGATQASQTITGFNLTLDCGMAPRYTIDGQKYFSHAHAAPAKGTLELTFEHNSTATTEKAAWRAETARAIRLKFTGSSFTTAGTAYSTKTLIVDCYGKYTDFSELGDEDGNNTVNATLELGYDSTAASAGQFIVVNSLTSLT
jgi:hypothetical protein